MGIRNFFKKRVKPLVDVPKWVGTRTVKHVTLGVFGVFKRYFVPRQQGAEESFDEAMQRLNVTDKDIDTSRRGLKRLTIVMSCMTLGIFGYFLYLMVTGAFSAAFVCLMVLCLSLVVTFRYHFWLFQYTKRKLGCSLQEWFREGVLGEKAE